MSRRPLPLPPAPDTARLIQQSSEAMSNASAIARATAPVTAQRPRLRGVSHHIAAMIWPFIALAAFADATGRSVITSLVIYTASATALFGISALYHRKLWQPAARQRMRRLDHAAIFLLIAGTYTPVCWLGLGPDDAVMPLVIVWVGAALGIVKSLVWITAPKSVTAALAVLVGWAPMIEAGRLYEGIGLAGVLWVGGGGILYTLGAVAYARRWPDPWPRTFGYHEVFHALVVAAAGCHLIAIARLV